MFFPTQILSSRMEHGLDFIGITESETVWAGKEGEPRQWAKRLFTDRMWPDVYLSSHQGHELARPGRGWHTAFPSSCLCQAA